MTPTPPIQSESRNGKDCGYSMMSPHLSDADAKSRAQQHGDGCVTEREGGGLLCAAEAKQVSALPLAPAEYGRAELTKHSKEEEEFGHVSETELLIAQVLAAMKDCALSSVEPTSASFSSSSSQTSHEAKAAARTFVQGNAPAGSSAKAATALHAAPQNIVLKTAVQTRCQADVHGAASSITSLRSAQDKENTAPLALNIDMQDERAQPKFRNLVDLYQQLSEPQSLSEAK